MALNGYRSTFERAVLSMLPAPCHSVKPSNVLNYGTTGGVEKLTESTLSRQLLPASHATAGRRLCVNQ